MTATRQPSRLASSLAWLGSAGVLARRGSRIGHPRLPLPQRHPPKPPLRAPSPPQQTHCLPTVLLRRLQFVSVVMMDPRLKLAPGQTRQE